MSKLDGKRVLITGGAQGIGLEMARKFAGRGADVVIADLNEAKIIAQIPAENGMLYIIDTVLLPPEK